MRRDGVMVVQEGCDMRKDEGQCKVSVMQI
jgi:hypothetical protein